MIKIGIIGYGYWGPNLTRNFRQNSECSIIKVADLLTDRKQRLARDFPEIAFVNSAEEVIKDKEIDAVVIATPVHTHFKLALEAIKNGKHVLVEKPMTSGSGEAQQLIELSLQKHLVLMVDHTFIYTGAVRKIKELLESNQIGILRYFDSTRINLGLFQQDINVLWDLAPHDISILSFIYNERPYSINAKGVSHTNNNIENIAYLALNYSSGFIAHFNCSWTSPVKIRTILIGGDKKMVLYNDIEPTEKIKVYDTGYQYRADLDKNKILVDYRIGDIYIPKLDNTEALKGVTNDFIHAIQHGKRPISDFELGLNVVKLLEASDKSIKQNGVEIKINWNE